MKRFPRSIAQTAMATCLVCTSNAWALNIVLSNDDGFDKPNIIALYQTLKAKGHNVIISAPYTNQSGRSGYVKFWKTVEGVELAEG